MNTKHRPVLPGGTGWLWSHHWPGPVCGRCDYYRCCDRYGPGCTQSHYSDHTSLQVAVVAAVVAAAAVDVVVDVGD